jgi:hypothetical protein
LEDAIIALKDRFVHRASSQDATLKFDQLRQDKTGVVGLYSKLMTVTSQMIEVPSAYDMRQRFLIGLILSIRTKILRCGFSAENSTLADMLQCAKQIEEEAYYNNRDAANSSIKSNGPEIKPSGPNVPTNNDSFRTPATALTVGGISKAQTSNLKCYNCGEVGHNSPNCLDLERVNGILSAKRGAAAQSESNESNSDALANDVVKDESPGYEDNPERVKYPPPRVKEGKDPPSE